MGLSFIRFGQQYLLYGCIAVFIILIFMFFISYDIIRKAIVSVKHEDKHQHDNTSLGLRILTYLNIFLLFIYMNSLLIRFMYPFKKDCVLISELCFTLFQLIRTIMFLIFIRRIQVIYSDTVFQLKDKYIYLLYTAVAAYLLPYACYINWSLLIDSKYDQQFSCIVIYKSPILFFVVSVLDSLISILCLYIFTFPLYQLIKHQDDISIKNQLFNIIIKISILYGSSILSSFILTSISFIYSFGFYYGIIDSLINGFLLILLHPIHNTCYKKICCVAHKCCIKCCNTFHTRKNKSSAARSQSMKSISTSRSSQLKLSKINVLQNITSNNIHEIEVQTPVDVLVHQGINNMYKKAASRQPILEMKVPQNEKQNTESIKLKPPQDDLDTNLNNMYKNAAFGKPTKDVKSVKLKIETPENDLDTNMNMYGNAAYGRRIKIKPIKTGLNVIHQSVPTASPGVQLSNGVQLSPSATVRHAMKMNISKRFNEKLKLYPFGISDGSSNPKQSLENQKSNTLQLINIQSNHL